MTPRERVGCARIGRRPMLERPAWAPYVLAHTEPSTPAPAVDGYVAALPLRSRQQRVCAPAAGWSRLMPLRTRLVARQRPARRWGGGPEPGAPHRRAGRCRASGASAGVARALTARSARAKPARRASSLAPRLRSNRGLAEGEAKTLYFCAFMMRSIIKAQKYSVFHRKNVDFACKINVFPVQ